MPSGVVHRIRFFTSSVRRRQQDRRAACAVGNTGCRNIASGASKHSKGKRVAPAPTSRINRAIFRDIGRPDLLHHALAAGHGLGCDRCPRPRGENSGCARARSSMSDAMLRPPHLDRWPAAKSRWGLRATSPKRAAQRRRIEGMNKLPPVRNTPATSRASMPSSMPSPTRRSST